MKNISMPPLFSSTENGEIIWKKMEAIDYDQIGILLCSHLIIEYYLDEYIKWRSNKEFNWVAAKLTFNQKISLLSTIKMPEKFNCIPAIKHLNTLRNKISHQVDSKLSKDDLLPIIHYLEKANNINLATKDVTEVLNVFLISVCTWFASTLTALTNPSMLGNEDESRRQFERWAIQHSLNNS